MNVSQVEDVLLELIKPVQKRTKLACVNCQAAKVACGATRPCLWCIKHELQDTCVDAPRKSRGKKRKQEDAISEDNNMDNNKYHSSNNNNNNTACISITNDLPNENIPLPFLSLTPSAPLLSLSQPLYNLLDDQFFNFPDATQYNPINLLNEPHHSIPIQPSHQLQDLPIVDTSPSVSAVNDIIQDQLRKIKEGMEVVSALTQMQTQNHNLPTARVRMPEGMIDYCNESFARTLGYSTAAELLNICSQEYLHIFPNEFRICCLTKFRKMSYKNTPKLSCKCCMVSKNGELKGYSVLLTPFGGGCTITILGMRPHSSDYVTHRMQSRAKYYKGKDFELKDF